MKAEVQNYDDGINAGRSLMELRVHRLTRTRSFPCVCLNNVSNGILHGATANQKLNANWSSTSPVMLDARRMARTQWWIQRNCYAPLAFEIWCRWENALLRRKLVVGKWGSIQRMQIWLTRNEIAKWMDWTLNAEKRSININNNVFSSVEYLISSMPNCRYGCLSSIFPLLSQLDAKFNHVSQKRRTIRAFGSSFDINYSKLFELMSICS